MLGALGVPAPHFMTWVSILTEVLGGLAVLVGGFVTVASIPMAMLLFAAIFTVHLPNGFSSVKLVSVNRCWPAIRTGRLRSRPAVSGVLGSTYLRWSRAVFPGLFSSEAGTLNECVKWSPIVLLQRKGQDEKDPNSHLDGPVTGSTKPHCTCPTPSSPTVPVTIDNYNRAQSDVYFALIANGGGFGKFRHGRDLAAIGRGGIIRPNRDTLYSLAVFDHRCGAGDDYVAPTPTSIS